MNEPVERVVDHTFARWVRARSGSELLARAAFAALRDEGQGHSCATLSNDDIDICGVALARVGRRGRDIHAIRFDRRKILSVAQLAARDAAGRSDSYSKRCAADAGRRRAPRRGRRRTFPEHRCDGDGCTASSGRRRAGCAVVRSNRRSRHRQDSDRVAHGVDAVASRRGVRLAGRTDRRARRADGQSGAAHGAIDRSGKTRSATKPRAGRRRSCRCSTMCRMRKRRRCIDCSIIVRAKIYMAAASIRRWPPTS